MVKDITQKDVHVTFGCRRFYEEDAATRTATNAHIGSHPKLIEGLIENQWVFKAYLKKLAEKAWAHVRGVSRTEPFHIVSWCRAGEKRSVGWAVCVYHCLTSVGMQPVSSENGAPIVNLCQSMWLRHTCNGTCWECANYLSPQKKKDKSVKKAVEWFTSEWVALCFQVAQSQGTTVLSVPV